MAGCLRVFVARLAAAAVTISTHNEPVANGLSGDIVCVRAVARLSRAQVLGQDSSLYTVREIIERAYAVNLERLGEIVGIVIQQSRQGLFRIGKLEIQALAAGVADNVAGL